MCCVHWCVRIGGKIINKTDMNLLSRCENWIGRQSKQTEAANKNKKYCWSCTFPGILLYIFNCKTHGIVASDRATTTRRQRTHTHRAFTHVYVTHVHRTLHTTFNSCSYTQTRTSFQQPNGHQRCNDVPVLTSFICLYAYSSCVQVTYNAQKHATYSKYAEHH